MEKINNNHSDNELSFEYTDDEEYNIKEDSNIMHEKYASETDDCRIYTENKSTQINGINDNTQMEQQSGRYN